ncbi:MAG TPA: hypothetical protein VFQ54_00210, partial [Thermomicrobiales bacterium]|nr:hypothetical protein [Thermomicrobiales bacterium]
QLTYRYTAVDIQNRELDPSGTPVLLLASALYMAAEVQAKLVDYLRAGGRLYLQGELPRFDMLGGECRLLLDALELEPVSERFSDHRTFLSVEAGGWAAPLPELRIGYAQTFQPGPGTVLQLYATEEAVGFDVAVGGGRAIVVTCDLPPDLDFHHRAFGQLGMSPSLTHDHPERNIFLTSTRNERGERFIHALNLDGFDKSIHLEEAGEPLLGGREVMLRARDGVMLPLDLDLGEGVRLIWSTAEVVRRRENGFTVRLTGESDELALKVGEELDVVADDTTEIVRDGSVAYVRILGCSAGEFIDIDWMAAGDHFEPIQS